MAGLLGTSVAADYPNKPVQIVVAYPPGGGGDTTARLVVNKVAEILGQSVVVVNKPGGNGVIGVNSVKGAPADGYTILVMQPSIYMAPLIIKNVPFNPQEDFTTLSVSVIAPNVIIVKNEARWRTIEEVIAEAKKNPGKVTFSLAGYGTSSHFAAELFKIQTGTNINSIPNDGFAPALTQILGGHLDLGTPEIAGAAHSNLQSKTIRGLALMGNKRHKDFPEIPTMAEKGFSNLINATWIGFVVRSTTLRAIIQKLEKTFQDALKDKQVVDMFEKTGWIVENLDIEKSGDFLKKQSQSWSEVAKAANIVPK
jgi:tripartite-type tricarboxylate transporter receptor subunit TctC